MTNTRITDAGLAHLRGMGKLQSLILNKDRITDAGMARLEPLTHLRQLWLFNTQITDEGLATLKPLAELEDLVIAVTQTTDSGLMHLKDLKNLKKLDITGTQVSDAGVEALQAAIPRLTIVGARVPPQAQGLPRSTGASRVGLLLNRSVQNELKLDSGQIRSVVKLAEETQAKTNAASVAVRDLPLEVNRVNFRRILNWYDREIDKQLTQIFTPDQLHRFHQIRYQVGLSRA